MSKIWLKPEDEHHGINYIQFIKIHHTYYKNNNNNNNKNNYKNIISNKKKLTC